MCRASVIHDGESAAHGKIGKKKKKRGRISCVVKRTLPLPYSILQSSTPVVWCTNCDAGMTRASQHITTTLSHLLHLLEASVSDLQTDGKGAKDDNSITHELDAHHSVNVRLKCTAVAWSASASWEIIKSASTPRHQYDTNKCQTFVR